MQTPLFMTHHSPVGAYASLSFGAVGKGVSIDLESPRIKEEGYDLYAGYSQDGAVMALPFRENLSLEPRKPDSSDEGNKETAKELKSGWQYFQEEEIRRTLTPCLDRYEAGRFTLEIYNPHIPLEDPEKGEISPYACCPGMLLRVVVDNRDGKTPATGYLGIFNRILRCVHSVQADGMQGFGCKASWMLLAGTDDPSVFLLRSYQLDGLLQRGERVLHETGPGAICVEAKPGERKELLAAFSFYTANPATCGIESFYYYTRHFQNVRQVCRFVLDHAAQIRQDSNALDAELEHAVGDPVKLQLLAQGIRGYEASTQLSYAGEQVFYNVGEGAYCWRNTLDLAADHLPWELSRNPWVVRNIMDLYISRYSYCDHVFFYALPGQEFEGGLSFTHDMGNFATFSAPGQSDYETSAYETPECYFHMTTEELLNGIYCIGAYGLGTGDTRWLQKHADVLRDLLSSLENRDAPEPALRDGILKAKSSRCGAKGRESTTYDALDHSLMEAAGNLYIAVKTGCALILLQKCLERLGDGQAAARAAAMLRLNQVSLSRFQAEGGYLRANLTGDSDSRVLAAIEPLAILDFLGIAREGLEPVRELLLRHIRSCMQPGYCIEETTGGVRLSSRSNNTWVSKVILCFAVMESVFGIDLETEYPTAMRELRHWCQVSARTDTVSDQILTTSREVLGGCYYPRIASSAVWIHRK